MRVGFYLTGTQSVERVLPLIARAAMKGEQRLLVTSGDADQLGRLGKELWDAFPQEFLAHGMAGGTHDARQPILLSSDCSPANGAKLLALADGQWREEAESFDRVLLFFDEAGRQAARTTWKVFDDREDVSREFHELDNGKWVQRA